MMIGPMKSVLSLSIDDDHDHESMNVKMMMMVLLFFKNINVIVTVMVMVKVIKWIVMLRELRMKKIAPRGIEDDKDTRQLDRHRCGWVPLGAKDEKDRATWN